MMLRGGDPQDGRQRRGAGSQVQKFSAGRFHFAPRLPFTSLDHLVGEREQRLGHLDAECLRDRNLRGPKQRQRLQSGAEHELGAGV